MAASLLPTARATWRSQIAGRCTQQPISIRRSAFHARLIHVQYSSCPPCDCLYPSKRAPAWKSSIEYGTLVSGPVFKKQFAPPYLRLVSISSPHRDPLCSPRQVRAEGQALTRTICVLVLCVVRHTRADTVADVRLKRLGDVAGACPEIREAVHEEVVALNRELGVVDCRAIQRQDVVRRVRECRRRAGGCRRRCRTC